MPLTTEGKKIKRSMAKTYGKKAGEKVFYAMENKMNKGSAMAKADGKAYGQGMAASKKPAGMAKGGVSAMAKAGGKAYGQGMAASKKPVGMAKGGSVKKGGKK